MDIRSEKERVYEELERVQRKCGRQKQEIAALRAKADDRNLKIAKQEASEYRKSLSYIAYRLDNGGIDEEHLREVVEKALFLRGLKKYQRDRIEVARAQSVSERTVAS
jgi:hypothetical protein